MSYFTPILIPFFLYIYMCIILDFFLPDDVLVANRFETRVSLVFLQYSSLCVCVHLEADL